MQCSFDNVNKSLFLGEQIGVMSDELYSILYPAVEAPVIPLVETEAVN